MDIVEAALSDAGADPGGIRIERFSPVDPVDPVDPVEPGHAVGHAAGEAGAGPAPGGASDARATEPARVTITLDGRVGTADHRAGTTILQTARQMGMAPPFSCESGNCATCMAKVVEGAVTMHVNNALTPEEVDDGWVLTCQAVPTTPSVGVVYGDEEA
jgi:ferredoxin